MRKQLEGLIFYLPSITMRFRNAIMSKWTKTPPECQLRGRFLFHPIERLSRITWQFYDYPFFFSRLFISKLLQICATFPQKCFQSCCRIRKENSVPRQLVCTHHQVADISACRFFYKSFLPKGRHHAAHRFIHVCIVTASIIVNAARQFPSCFHVLYDKVYVRRTTVVRI